MFTLQNILTSLGRNKDNMKTTSKVFTFKYGMNWIAARGGCKAKYRSSSLEQALKQFEIAHPEEFARGDYELICDCGKA